MTPTLPAWFGDDTAGDAPRPVPAFTLPAGALDGLSIYQDVVLAGNIVRKGVRDCGERWGLLEPHLPRRGAVLDVGSNFGWFALEICQAFPACVVASVEADERSAAVQRVVLESHALERACLLTEPANAGMIERFAQCSQRFEAALCLSVLHWLPDHREFLTSLGRITSQLFIEHPDPRETGAGSTEIRGQIGQIGPYLAELFPDRTCEMLGRTTSHRSAQLPRELWRVGPAAGAATTEASETLAVEALADLSPAWPARDWWLDGFDRQVPELLSGRELRLTPNGLVSESGATATSAAALRRKLARIPQEGIATFRTWWYRRLRGAAGTVLRAVGMRRAG